MHTFQYFSIILLQYYPGTYTCIISNQNRFLVYPL